MIHQRRGFSGGIWAEFPKSRLGIHHPPKWLWEMSIPESVRKAISAAVFFIVCCAPNDGFSQEKTQTAFDVDIACTLQTSNQIWFILPQDPFEMQETVLRCTTKKVSQVLGISFMTQEDFDKIAYSDTESFGFYTEILSSEDYKKEMYPFIAEYYVRFWESPSWKMQLMLVDFFLARQEWDSKTQQALADDMQKMLPYLPLEALLTQFWFISI